jgi:hypothetical protein
MDDLLKMLRELQDQQFFGAVEAKFENGRVTVIRKIQTYVPNDRDKRGGIPRLLSTPISTGAPRPRVA